MQTAISAVPHIKPTTPHTGSDELIDIGYGVKLTPEQLLTITPKDYKELTGHRLGFLKSKLLTAVQKNASKVTVTGKAAGADKSQTVALILVILLGGLGIHHFYLGYTW